MSESHNLNSLGPVDWPVYPDREDIIFRGHREQAGPALITVETTTGDTLGLLTHHVRHSPDGFQWGYNGSGPAEVARCLLLASIEHSQCDHCGGTAKVILEGDGSHTNPLQERPFVPGTDDPNDELVLDCSACDDGLTVVPHQDFKRAFVAGWTGDWSIARSQIRDWLATQLQAADTSSTT